MEDKLKKKDDIINDLVEKSKVGKVLLLKMRFLLKMNLLLTMANLSVQNVLLKPFQRRD